MLNSSFTEKENDYQKERNFGEQIFKALKGNQLPDWIALYPTQEEFKNMLEAMLSVNMEGLTQEKIDEMLTQRKAEAAEYYGLDFNRFLQLAEASHITWNHTEYKNFDFTISYPDRIKLKYLNGEIHFTCNGRYFEIEGIEAVEIENGYRLQSVRSIRELSAPGY